MTATECWKYFTEEKNPEMGLEEKVGNEAENREGCSRFTGFLETYRCQTHSRKPEDVAESEPRVVGTGGS